MAKLTFHKTTQADIEYIAANMWHEDVAELYAAGNKSIIKALQNSVKCSKTCVIAKYNDTPLVVYGLRNYTVLGRQGIPWMLTTTKSKKHKREFMIYTRRVVELMLDECDYLYNYVHSKNKTSIKWLKVLGFTIDTPFKNANTGEYFHRFWLRR